MRQSIASRGASLALVLALTSLAAPRFALAQATAPASAPAADVATKTGLFEVTDPLPPAEHFSKLTGQIARTYAAQVPAKSFAELRAFQYEGGQEPPSPPGPEVPADAAVYTHYVPPAYKPDDKPYGLLVWIAPRDGLGIERLPKWRDACDAHRVIWVEPHHVSNPAHSVWRSFMALEAVRQARRRYNIDPDRIYLSGFSGGGRIASHTVVFFPDVFSGAFSVCGCNFWRDVPAGDNRVWPGFWRNPDMAVVRRARANTRLALLTGSADFNQPSTKGIYEEALKDKWAHVDYFEVPSMDHKIPGGEWFEKALVALDAPLTGEAEQRYQAAVDLEKRKKPGEACVLFESVARHGPADKPFVADARTRASAIRKRCDEQVAQVERLIAEKQYTRAGPAAAQLKTEFAPIATEQAEDLLERVRQSQKSPPTTQPKNRRAV